LFFIPAIPLSRNPVKTGDTWDTHNTWKTDPGKIELTVDLHAKMLGQKPCGDHMCANIDVTGVVHMPGNLEKRNHFEHKITGRFLFEPARGLVPWSQFESDEQLQGEEVQVVVHSVLRSELIEPLGYRTAGREEPSCPFETKAE
jgi:hypothetical protein